jgi:hypothetical protein
MSLALRGDKADNGVTPNKYTLEGILGIPVTAAAGMNRTEIFRGSGMRQNLVFVDDRVAKDEMSLVPGMSSSMAFPVPATIPAVPERTKKGPQTYQPSPRVFDALGTGYGGYGGFNVGTDGAGGSRGLYGN